MNFSASVHSRSCIQNSRDILSSLFDVSLPSTSSVLQLCCSWCSCLMTTIFPFYFGEYAAASYNAEVIGEGMAMLLYPYPVELSIFCFLIFSLPSCVAPVVVVVLPLKAMRIQ